MAQADLTYTYDLRPIDASRPLGSISADFAQFEKSLQASAARVISFGLTAGAILGVQRAFSSLVKETINVEKSLADINSVFQLSSRQLSEFGAKLFEIGKNTGQNFSAITEAAKNLARQGLSVNETLARTSAALILTRQSGLDAEDSVRAITAALNSFQKEALTATGVINKLANVDNSFAVSSKDLAEAITRTGSAAEGAGVKFDELIGLVVSAQQTSQRGGAVIAQALNSVFARISRPETIEQLKELGVQINASQSGVEKLKALSNAINGASQEQSALIKDAAGGIRNLNVLSAVLTDLQSKYSLVARATQESANATDEAIVRNEKLNETYATLANKTVLNIQQVGAQFGKLTLGPGLENVLTNINKILEGAISKNSESAGEILGKGILSGLGQFLSGPGLILVGASILKLLQRLAVDAGSAFKTILGLNDAASQRASLELSINSVLSKQPELIKLAVGSELQLLEAVKGVNLAFAAQNEQAVARSAIATRLLSGNSGGSRGSGAVPRFYNSNRNEEIPNFALPFKSSSKQLKSSDLSKYVSVYHAGASENLKGILQNGLIPNQAGVVSRDPRGRLVFLSSSGQAAFIAGKYEKELKLENNFRGRKSGNDFVLEAVVPREMLDFDTPNADIVASQVIPPKYFNRLFKFSKGDNQGFDNFSFSKSRYLQQDLPFTPNFSSISDAINRELHSGVPSSSVRIGNSANLVSPSNPLGQGVYNTINEPGGLSQGINRAISEGRNPKTYNIPSFANYYSNIPSNIPDPFRRGPGSILIGGQQKSELDLAIQSLKDEAKGTSISLDDFKKKVNDLSSTFNLTNDSTKTLQQNLTKSYQYYQRSNSQVSTGSAISDDLRQIQLASKLTQLQATTKNIPFTQEAFETTLRRLQSVNKPNSPPLVPSSIKYDEQFGPGFGDSVNIFRNQQFINQIKLRERQRVLASGALGQQIREEGIFGPTGGNPNLVGLQSPELQAALSRNRQRLATLGVERPDPKFTVGGAIPSPELTTQNIYKKIDDYFKTGKGQNVAIGTSLVLPILAGAISQASGDRTKEARGLGQSVQSLGNIGSYTALGGTLFGAPGAIGGAAVGGLLELPKVFESFSSTIPDLNREIEKLTTQINEVNQGFSNIIVTNEKLAAQRRGDLDLSPVQYGNLLTNRKEEISKLINQFPDRALDIKRAASSGDPGDLEKIASELIPQRSGQIKEDELRILVQKLFPKSTTVRSFNTLGSKIGNIANLALGGADTILNTLTGNTEAQNENILRIRQTASNFTGTNLAFNPLDAVTKPKLDEDTKKIYEQIINASILTRSEEGPFKNKNIQDVLTERARTGDTKNLDRINVLIERLQSKPDDKELFIGLTRELSRTFAGTGNAGRSLPIVEDLYKQSELAGKRETLNKLGQLFSPDLIKGGATIPDVVPRDRSRDKFESELEKFGDGLDSLSARIKILSQSKLQDLQRSLNLENKISQNVADVNILRAKSNPFLSLSYQEAESQNQAQRLYRTKISEIGINTSDAQKEAAAQLFTNLKNHYIEQLSRDKGPDQTTKSRDSFKNLIQGLLDPHIGSGFITLPQDPIKTIENLSDETRKNLISNTQGILKTKELRLESGDVIGTNRKDARNEIKDIQNFLKLNQTLLTGDKKQRDAALKDLQAILESNKSDEDKKRQEFINSAVGTYNVYSDNLDKLAEISKKVYEDLKNSGLNGEAAAKEAAYRISQQSLPLTQSQYRAGTKSGSELRTLTDKTAQDELAATGRVSGQTFTNVFNTGLSYNARDQYSDLLKDITGIRDALASIRPLTRDAFASMVDGTKTAKNAFRDLGTSIATNLLNNIAKLSFDQLFGGIGKLFGSNQTGFASIFNNIFSSGKNMGGLITGYAGGGIVSGGSGMRDDVPAMLSQGAFVIRKNSVNKYGSNFLNSINNGREFDSGGGVNSLLTNDFNVNKKGVNTTGNFNVSPGLSVIGQTDENNPHNAVKFGTEQDYISYLNTIQQYKQAGKDFQQQKNQRLIGAAVSAAISIGGAEIGSISQAKIDKLATASQGGNADASIALGDRAYKMGDYSASQGFYNRAYGQTMSPNSYGPYTPVTWGGRGYASGGGVDNVPAMLTAGEFVMSPKAVNRMGRGYMERLNAGQISPQKYATGGLVGKDINSVSTVLQETTASNAQLITSSNLRMVKVLEEIRDLNSGAKSKVSTKNDVNDKNKSNNDVNNTTAAPSVSIIINMAANGTTSTQTNSQNTDNSAPSAKNMQAFAEIMKNVTISTIVEQQRSNGLLANTKSR